MLCGVIHLAVVVHLGCSLHVMTTPRHNTSVIVTRDEILDFTYHNSCDN